MTAALAMRDAVVGETPAEAREAVVGPEGGAGLAAAGAGFSGLGGAAAVGLGEAEFAGGGVGLKGVWGEIGRLGRVKVGPGTRVRP